MTAQNPQMTLGHLPPPDKSEKQQKQDMSNFPAPPPPPPPTALGAPQNPQPSSCTLVSPSSVGQQKSTQVEIDNVAKDVAGGKNIVDRKTAKKKKKMDIIFGPDAFTVIKNLMNKPDEPVYVFKSLVADQMKMDSGIA